MTEFKKIIYMDSDTLVLKVRHASCSYVASIHLCVRSLSSRLCLMQNIDHLALEPTFTSAFTYSCCNRNDLPRISGGLWVLEPDRRVGEYVLAHVHVQYSCACDGGATTGQLKLSKSRTPFPHRRVHVAAHGGGPPCHVPQRNHRRDRPAWDVGDVRHGHRHVHLPRLGLAHLPGALPEGASVLRGCMCPRVR